MSAPRYCVFVNDTVEDYIWNNKAFYSKLWLLLNIHLQPWRILQGRVTRRWELSRRIAVTLSIFNFSRWFLVEIVENRRGRLSRPFLSPGDNFFEKLWRNPDLVGAARPKSAGPKISQNPVPNPRHTTAIQICFRHNFSKNYPHDLKWFRKTPPAILYNLH